MLIGKKVFLRILEEEDLPRTQKWINDPEISHRLGVLPTSLKQQKNWFTQISQDNSRFIFAICLNNEKKSQIGNVSIGNIDYIHRNGRFAIFIHGKEHRQQGYGTEATILLLQFAFERLNLHRVYLKTSQDYTGAIAMYKKLGFVQDGLLRDHEYSHGQYHDKLVFSLLKPEYFGKKEQWLKTYLTA